MQCRFMDLDWSLRTADALADLGMSRWQRRAACAEGRLHVVGPGLYLCGPRLEGEAGWWQDAAIACARTPGAALCGAAAADVYGLDGFAANEAITVSVPPTASGRGGGVKRLTRLQPPRTTGGLTVTAPRRHSSISPPGSVRDRAASRPARRSSPPNWWNWPSSAPCIED